MTGSGANIVHGNRINGNSGDGIKVLGGDGWTISRNTSSGNVGPGINLVVDGDGSNGVTPNDPGDGDDGPNTALNWPEFTLAGGTTGDLTGTACRGCNIEFFVATLGPAGFGDGYQFLGSTFTDAQGAFAFQICGRPLGTFVTATATDSAGNTSEFGANYTVDEDTPDCHHITGDLDCDLAVDPRDALLAVLHDSGAPDLSQEDGCPHLGDEVTAPTALAPAASVTFGDVDCDGDIDTTDAMAILRYVAHLPAEPGAQGGCPAIGQ
jgi:parallel beta-helix repeat protein